MQQFTTFFPFFQADHEHILQVLEELENDLERARREKKKYEQAGKDTTDQLTFIAELKNRKVQLLTQYGYGEDGIPEEV